LIYSLILRSKDAKYRVFKRKALADETIRLSHNVIGDITMDTTILIETPADLSQFLAENVDWGKVGGEIREYDKDKKSAGGHYVTYTATGSKPTVLFNGEALTGSRFQCTMNIQRVIPSEFVEEESHSPETAVRPAALSFEQLKAKYAAHK